VRRVRLARWVGPAAVLGVGLLVGVAALLVGGDGEAGVATTTTEPEPYEMESSAAHRWVTLDELVEASAVVVRGQVVHTTRGELLGAEGTDPAAAGVVVREVTIQVDEVLHRSDGAPLLGPGERIVVAEEGWLSTGEPLVVDGLAPSAPGDDAVWFLDALPAGEDADPTSEGPTYVVVGSQGRYVVDGTDGLRGAEGDDALVASIESMSPDQLRAELRG
jgi:hypothetical protein